MMKLYVGNLHYNVTQVQLQELFSQAGEVTSAYLSRNKYTSKSSGFGFIEMATYEAAQKAIQRFHGQSLLERPMTVHEAAVGRDAGWKGSAGTVVIKKLPQLPEVTVAVERVENDGQS